MTVSPIENDYPKFWRPSGHMTFALSVIFILQMRNKFRDAPFLMANSFCVVGLIYKVTMWSLSTPLYKQMYKLFQ